MGVSPVSGPTPNKGYEAAGLQQLGVIMKDLEKVIPMLGASSDAGAAALKALTAIAKFVPAGSVSPASQTNMYEQARMKSIQQNQQMQAQKMQALKQQGAGGQPPGGAPQGAMAA